MYANENRIPHPVFESDNLTAYTIDITADSPGFEFAQNKFREVGIELTAREGGIEVAGIFLAPLAPLVVETIKLGIYFGTLYLLRNQIEDAAEGVIDIYQAVADSAAYQTLSISQDDVITTGTPPFPGDTGESRFIIEVFPKGNTPDDILDLDGRFYTPLESYEFSSTTTFPQRDEALEAILNGGIFLGGEEAPQGSYFLAAAETNPIVQDLINEAGQPTITKGNTEIYPPVVGGYEKAQRIFNSLNPSEVNSITNSSSFNGFRGVLEDGRRIIIRDGSRGQIGSDQPGPPTLEIQRADGRRILKKFRFVN